MSKKRKKQPKRREEINPKTPRSLHSRKDGQIHFSFSLFDGQTHWCEEEEYDDGSFFHGIANKLRHYETMRWTEIVSRDHPVARNKLIQRAQNRLSHLKLDDTDYLWRFQLDGLKRIWGVRVVSCFHILWWDPLHAVCPSTLRNT